MPKGVEHSRLLKSFVRGRVAQQRSVRSGTVRLLQCAQWPERGANRSTAVLCHRRRRCREPFAPATDAAAALCSRCSSLASPPSPHRMSSDRPAAAAAAASAASSSKRPAAEMSGSVEAGSAAKKAHVLPRCPYGTACFRKNPQHIADFDHSAAAPLEAGPAAPHCPYGWQWSAACGLFSALLRRSVSHSLARCCSSYRKNSQHRAETYHAPPPKYSRARRISDSIRGLR